jgi:hypothetical protein
MRIARLLQVRQAALGNHKRAAGVDLMHQVVTLDRRVGGTGQPDRAGVVDHDVDAAEMLRCLRHRCTHLRLLANVHLQGQRPAASSLHRGGSGMDGARELRIGHTALGRDHHVGAVAGGAQRDRQPDAAGGTGDEEGFAGQLAHARLLMGLGSLVHRWAEARHGF